MDDEKIHIIKHDLRHLRKITHSIEVLLTCKERHEKRLELLRQGEQTAERLAEQDNIAKVLSLMEIEESIRKATEIEMKYSEAISKLDLVDRTIIVDGYINGKAYWKIGRDIGYTEVCIQKKVNRIFEKLAKLI